jgi:hypothetical protein
MTQYLSKFIILASQLLVRVFNKSISVEDMNVLLQQHLIMPNKPVAAERIKSAVELEGVVCVR